MLREELAKLSGAFVSLFQEARDSRLFGPLPMSDIVGRVIYCLQSAIDHGPVQNR